MVCLSNTNYTTPQSCDGECVHSVCRAIMSDIDRDSRVLSLGNRTGLRQSLVTLLDQLGRCQKALNEFLEVKYCSHHLMLSVM